MLYYLCAFIRALVKYFINALLHPTSKHHNDLDDERTATQQPMHGEQKPELIKFKRKD